MPRADDDATIAIRVRCADVPASLPEPIQARWLERLPKPQRRALAARLARGTGLPSLTVLALLAGLVDTLPLPLERLQWTACGKPRIPQGPQFSLTHSRGFAACAVNTDDSPIGIDLEPAGRVRSAAVALVADAAERRALAEGRMTPTGLWTVKEAVLKAAGAGLPEIRGVTVRDDVASFAGIDYRWRHIGPGSGLLLAVATRDTLPHVGLDWLSWPAVFV